MTAILLAAGQGSRLGRGPKALLRRSDGGTLVEHLAAVLHEGGCSPVVIVLGAGAERIRGLPGLAGHHIVDNPEWPTGLSSSLRAGLKEVPAGSRVLVALVDQPGLDPATVRRLLETHRPGNITAAGYASPFSAEAGETPHVGLRRGHPVLFDPADLPGVRTAGNGDAGARSYLDAHSHRVELIDCSDRSDGGDIDTESELFRLG